VPPPGTPQGTHHHNHHRRSPAAASLLPLRHGESRGRDTPTPQYPSSEDGGRESPSGSSLEGDNEESEGSDIASDSWGSQDAQDPPENPRRGGFATWGVEAQLRAMERAIDEIYPHFNSVMQSAYWVEDAIPPQVEKHTKELEELRGSLGVAQEFCRGLGIQIAKLGEDVRTWHATAQASIAEQASVLQQGLAQLAEGRRDTPNVAGRLLFLEEAVRRLNLAGGTQPTPQLLHSLEQLAQRFGAFERQQQNRPNCCSSNCSSCNKGGRKSTLGRGGWRRSTASPPQMSTRPLSRAWSGPSGQKCPTQGFCRGPLQGG